MNVFFVSLGCDKNLVDSEVMLGILRERGFGFTDDEAEADVIIVNSCCFIGDAKEESINTILQMAEYKPEGSCQGKLKALVVTGCLAQRYAEEIKQEIPEVDACVGTTAYDKIAAVLDRVLAGEKQVSEIANINDLPLPDSRRIITTGGYYSYLKIAEGCDKYCTYCIIPKLRGSYRSVPIERLVNEAKELVESGVRELILVAQETTLYGTDLYGEKSLPRLLKELCKLEDLKWIRILYCYPEEITDELIDTIKNEKKICNYIDMPIQHASDSILKRMGRRTNRDELSDKIARIREAIPDIALRTTLISGFPGETQEDHELLMEFVNETEFDRLGVFTYSAEEDTAAASMPDQIDEEVKVLRRDEIMQLQQEIAYEHAENMVGRTMEALIEGRVVEEDIYAARTYMDAPNVDGFVFINSSRELMSGDVVFVKITGANEYDLIGELVDESTE